MKHSVRLSLALGLVLAGGLAIADSKTLTIASWGGAYSYSQLKAYHEPYTAKTGIKVVNEDPGSAAPAGIKAQVESGKVTWDLADVLEPDAMRLCDEGLLEEIDIDSVLAKAPDGTPASKDWVGGLSKCFIPSIVYSTLFAYNTSMFPADKAPKSIKDVFDLKAFPGKRALEKTPYGNLEWALMADGVSYDKVYEVLSTPAGIDRAFKKLDSIKPQVIWWEKGAQPPQLLADKEVAIATSYNGRIFDAQVKEKQPFKIIWDGQLQEFDGWVIPKGSPNKAEVLKYLGFAADTQRLADQAKYISYGPARKSSAPMVSTHAETCADMKPHMPTNPDNMHTAIVKNAKWWSENYETINQRFSAWLAK